jgi:hypothetical protein
MRSSLSIKNVNDPIPKKIAQAVRTVNIGEFNERFARDHTLRPISQD